MPRRAGPRFTRRIRASSGRRAGTPGEAATGWRLTTAMASSPPTTTWNRLAYVRVTRCRSGRPSHRWVPRAGPRAAICTSRPSSRAGIRIPWAGASSRCGPWDSCCQTIWLRTGPVEIPSPTAGSAGPSHCRCCRTLDPGLWIPTCGIRRRHHLRGRVWRSRPRCPRPAVRGRLSRRRRRRPHPRQLNHLLHPATHGHRPRPLSLRLHQLSRPRRPPLRSRPRRPPLRSLRRCLPLRSLRRYPRLRSRSQRLPLRSLRRCLPLRSPRRCLPLRSLRRCPPLKSRPPPPRLSKRPRP